MNASAWVTPPSRQTVAFGIPVADALPEALRRLSLQNVAVVTTNSLAAPGGLAETIGGILGDRLHSITAGIIPHTPRSGVIRVAKTLEGADGVLALGGGSVCDTVKAARLCLANGIADPEDIDRFRPYGGDGSDDPTIPPSLPFIAIPTALAAAEFTSGAGVTDERRAMKQVFFYPNLGPDIVILDPEMTLRTPSRLFFATGLRALDHAVESWCSINPNPLSDAYSMYAARLLIPSLRKVFASPDDLEARLDCMKAAWLSILELGTGRVRAGASHGIGHALGGTGGMPHGETTCVMLPHVLRYNAAVNADRQAAVSTAVGQPGVPLADIVADLVATLGLPGRLRDTDISRSSLDAIAEVSLHDPSVASNPRPITTMTEVRGLLEDAW